MPNLTREEFVSLVERARRERGGAIAVPLALRVLSDQLTPVLAYRRLVAPDAREAPSFLFESVEGGERVGRYSILGAQPVRRIVARGGVLRDTAAGEGPCADPLAKLGELCRAVRLVRPPSGRGELPGCLLGGWVGYAAYDSVRYAEPGKLPFESAPRDDRNLPDVDFSFYDGVVVFDHAAKVVYVVQLAVVGAEDDSAAAYHRTVAKLHERLAAIETHSKPLRSGLMERPGQAAPPASNLTRDRHAEMVAKAKEYIRAGDVFQVVVGQRFERTSRVDPFDAYRALRAVNPSPYMVYMQCEGCILVASSPEILCRVRRVEGGMQVTNRPLAGTRRRGATAEEDVALEQELLADQKERSEHLMLVDLGRNDVGKVAIPGTVSLPRVMEVERYSHVMHISSTVTGLLRPGLDCWDALRAALPVGTISGAPKVRAMQIIDELEPVRRGPYGGGMGYAGLDGEMDIALALRTMVVVRAPGGGGWVYFLQAAGGIVAESDAADEYQETVNKAAALARAIDVAEAAFGG